MKQRLASLMFGLGLMSSSFAEMRTWTSSAGTSIEAEYVKSDAQQVTLLLKNGKTNAVPLSKLSAADQDFIKAQASKATHASAPVATSVPTDRKARWQSKFDRAKKEAEETGLPILLVFSGTEWCTYCVQLDKALFSKDEFQTYANQNLVLMKIDMEPGGVAPNRAAQKLAQEFSGRGVPRYYLLDSQGKTLGQQNGFDPKMSPKVFAEWVKGLTAKAE